MPKQPHRAPTKRLSRQAKVQRKVFSLDGVPESEAAAVRGVLRKNGISFFEVPGGRWLRGGGLFVRSEQKYVEARRLIDAYQADLRKQHRKETRRFDRSPRSIDLGRLRERPALSVLLLAVIIVLIVGTHGLITAWR